MTNYGDRLNLGKSFVEIYDDNIIKGLGLCLCLSPLSKQYISVISWRKLEYLVEKPTDKL